MKVYVVTRSEEHSDYVEKVFTSKVYADEYCQKYNNNEDEYHRDITECDIEGPISEDLDEAAKASGQRHFPDSYNIWAGPNYESQHAELAFKEGANWQKKQMIDKACEWLEDNLSDKTSVLCSGVVSISFDNVLNEFKKAMEEWK